MTTGHEKFRQMLPLAAAGALEPAEQAELEQHLAGCAACTDEMLEWRLLGGALRRLPTPQPSPQTVERARAAAERQLAARGEGRWNMALLGLALLLTWSLTLGWWMGLRLVRGEWLSWLDGGDNLMLWLLGYTALGWFGAAVAAVLLGLRRRRMA